MTPADIIEIADDRYIAHSGLGRLDPYPGMELDHVMIGGVDTVRNENGILFRAMIHAHLEDWVGKFSGRIPNDFSTVIFPSLEHTLVGIAVPGYPGLYNRNIGGARGRSDSHDNGVGICALSVIYDDPQPARDMVKWANDNAYCFNNVFPESWDLRQVRQPGDIALYYMAARLEPPAFCWAWLLAGLWSNAANKPTPGQAHLAWLRIWTLNRLGAQHLPGWRGARYREVRDFWWDRLVQNWGSLYGVTSKYFRWDHPINLIGREREGK